MTAKTKNTRLRDALAQRKSRTEHYDIPLVDSDTARDVAQRVEDATGALKQGRVFMDADAVKAAEAELAEARAEYAKCFHRLTFKGLSQSILRELEAQHPPTDEQKADGATWNPDTYYPALYSASYVGDDGMTADEWADELISWEAAESAALMMTVLSATSRQFGDGLPKS